MNPSSEIELPPAADSNEKRTPVIDSQASVLGVQPISADILHMPPTRQVPVSQQASAMSSQTAAPPPVAAVVPEMRSFNDARAIRKNIFDRVLAATRSIQPVSNSRHTLRLVDVDYQDGDKLSKKQQKQAILNNLTPSRRLSGTWELVDNQTGEIIDKKRSVVMRVPHFTDRGTFINKGVEYALKNQQRLLPGVYTRVQSNGDIETMANIMPGKGPSHRYYLDPEKGTFKIKIGQGTVGLLPLLKTMGVADKDIQEAWGGKLYAANLRSDNAAEYAKLRSKFLNATELQKPIAEQEQLLRDKFVKMELDPEVTKRTLGQPFQSMTSDAILAITKKLIGVSKGEEEVDDRDSLAYQRFYGPEDLLAERIERDKDGIRKAVLWKMSNKGNLKSMPSSVLTPQLQSALISSGLGLALEEINPTEILDKMTSTTRMGEGGIASADAIPAEARSVQPSMLNFIDPLRTPECYDRETEVMTRRGWVKWPDVSEDDEFACLIEGRLSFHRASRLIRQHYKGPMYGADTGNVAYLVTPNHRLWVRPLDHGSQYRIATAQEYHDRPRRVCSGGFAPYAGDQVDTFVLPKPEILSNNTTLVDMLPIELWAELMGWWLGEGSLSVNEKRGNWVATISQCRATNSANCARIEALLNELPFKWSYNRNAYVIGRKQLVRYLQQFGLQPQRYIPEYLLRAPEAARQRLYEALMLGEGRRDRRGVRTQFCTSSLSLARTFERLAFSLGYASRTTFERDDREQSNTGGCWIVHVHKTNEHQIRAGLKKRDQCFILDFNDDVFCATVPGGLLYVRRGNTIGHWSGNSSKVGIDVYTARGAMKGSDGKLYSKFLDVRTGEEVYKNPQQVSDLTVGFPDALRSQDDVVPAMRKGRMSWVKKSDIDLIVPRMEDALNPMSNLIPMKSQTKGQRLVMASRMLSQALPLVDAEAPLVQSAVPGTEGRESFESMYGNTAGAIRADKPGQVISIDADEIRVRYADGTEDTHELYNSFPLNRKTLYSQQPLVAVGDTFEPGQLLAKSNFTDKTGAIAVGKNARTAYMVSGGSNFEDAITISRSFAERMRSEHMYQHQLETDDKTLNDKKKYLQLFPGTYNKETLAKMDDNGVIRPGTEVKYGDPLVLGITQKEASHNRIHRKGATNWSDATVTWEHHDPGVVTDVAMTSGGPLVVVKSTAAMQVGDKLCYDEDTEVLTSAGWKPIVGISYNDQICTLQANDEIQYLPPTALHYYPQGGRMYRIKSQQIDQFVTDNHRMYVCKRDAKSFALEPAKELFGKRVSYKKNGNWHGQSPSEVVLPGVTVKAGQFGRGTRELPEIRLSVPAYMMLLGAFISEGNLIYQPSSGSFGMDLTQIKEPNRSQLREALDAYGIVYYEDNINNKFKIHSKVMYEHFKRFGRRAALKRLPREIFSWGTEDLKTLFKWLMWGDGHSTDTGRPVCYTTVSRGLADDIQQLCLHIGYAANVINDLPATVQTIKGKEYNCLPRYSVRVITKKLTPTVNHGHVKRQNIQEEYFVENYDRPVYCVTVPGHVIYVRRDGKPCWSGNSGRIGDKGVIGAIIDDEDMPKGEDGRPYEVLLNPLSVVTRVNPTQMSELFLGKIAEKLGRPIAVEDFDSEKEMDEWVREQLREHGIKDLEDVLDPTTGRKIKGIATGNRFFMKLHHMSEGKLQGRSGGAYSMDESPAKGGVEGAKRMGLLESSSLLAHGGLANLQDASIVRGQRNDQYWAQFLSGHNPTAVKIPFAYKKFVNQLKASGINVVPDGQQIHIMAMTDKDIDQLAGDREITSSEGVDWAKGMKEIEGGLFDKGKTGGHSGCFHPTVRVWTEHGMIPIGEIVNNRMKVNVWSYDFKTCKFVLRPVVNWFRNRCDKAIGYASWSKRHARFNGNYSAFTVSTLWGTQEHQVYTVNGGKLDLQQAKKLLAACEKLSSSQEQVLLGSMLGDGFITKNGVFTEAHSVRQAGYLEFKRRMFKELSPGELEYWLDNSGGLSRQKCRLRLRAHASFYAMRELMYGTGKKRITAEFLDKINELGLAVWFMDDGTSARSKHKNTINIGLCTNASSVEEVDLLRSWLEAKWGIKSSRYRDKKYVGRDIGWIIAISGNSSERLLDIVYPYILPCMTYKLGGLVRQGICRTCGSATRRAREICTSCLIAEARVIGSSKLPKNIRRRLGGSAAVREMVAGLRPLPVEDERADIAANRIREAGYKLTEVLADAKLHVGVTEIDATYVEAPTKRYANVKWVYDITVAGLHNYVANGIVVSNSNWSFFKLAEPMPNPVLEDPIKKLLGLTGKKFEAVLSGDEELKGHGTGPQAIKSALEGINIDREIESQRAIIRAGKVSYRDAAIKKLGLLKSAKQLGIHPSEYMLTKVPVLPPMFRPIAMMGNELPLIDDANHLYKELFEANKNLARVSSLLGPEAAAEERTAVYNAFKAVTGLGDPIGAKNQEQGVKGILSTVFGNSPKYSTLQRKLLSTTVDNVGRGVITPNPSFDMDTIGIPENSAYKIYDRPLTRRLVRRGMSVLAARQEIENRSKLAQQALLEEMEERPVLASRAPVLHKYGIMAFRPKLVKSNTLEVSPLIVAPFGADFDGNCCDFDTELLLLFDRSLLQSGELSLESWSEGHIEPWKEMTMRTCGKSLVELIDSGNAFKVKIGEIPRVGEPMRGKDNQEIYDLPPGLSVLSYDPATCQPVYTPITKITIDRNHACREVKTRSGREVIVSDNESLCVFDSELGQVRKMAPADSIGKLSPVIRKYPETGSKFSFELGWLYGVLAADGWKQTRTLGYSKNDSGCRAEVERIVREHISDAFSKHEYHDANKTSKFGDSFKIHLNGMHMVAKVLDFVHPDHADNPQDRAALYKKYPDEVLYGGSRECLLGMLSGAIDGDASVGWNKAQSKRRFFCRFNTSSRYLRDSIFDLLLRLGIRYSLTVTPPRNNSKESYTICPSVIDLAKVLPECRIVHAERRQVIAEFLEEAQNTEFRDNLDIVPISKDLAQCLCSLIYPEHKTLYATLQKAKKVGTLGRDSARRVKEIVGDIDHPHFAAFCTIADNDDITWHLIESAEVVPPRDVFDLEVPETKVFAVNNGLIIWDTMNFHVPATDKAVEEAYERLLPSKNLFKLSDMRSVAYAPKNEFVAGLHHATKSRSDRPVRIFRSVAELREAYAKKTIAIDDPVQILEQ